MEEIIFTTGNSGSVSSFQSREQSSLSQSNAVGPNAMVRLPNGSLLVAQSNKALINVYNLNGSNMKRESIHQRLPIPEKIISMNIVKHLNDSTIELPYLLLCGTNSGTLYIWELSSGCLLQAKQMAHYQGIIKIDSMDHGRYIITGGKDGRIIIWDTVELVSGNEDIKPLIILHDHTLPITDFVLSKTYGDYLSSSGSKLITSSQDSTIRCYSLNKTQTGQLKGQLICTFSNTKPIKTMVLDHADRCLYYGTNDGVFSLPLFYRIDKQTIIDILGTNNTGTSKGKIFTLIKESNDTTRSKLYSMSQILIESIYGTGIELIELSMDGSILIIGGSEGTVSILEIYSKQIIRNIQSIINVSDSSSDANNGVNNLMVQVVEPNAIKVGETHHTNTQRDWKIPTLQRAVYDRKGAHDVWVQLNDRPNPEEQTFEKYMDEIADQSKVFTQLGSVISEVKVTGSEDSTDTSTTPVTAAEIVQLKANLKSLTEAYGELRNMHEQLFQEHQTLLDQNNASK
ncbi:hypothetical protein TBLA_0B09730 [Henningerozyma blattae CBS 6284]|uniref:Pre-rRNA-processing protein IPI3 n=1 Tax=Henningerozyma blattae (strain ATCC 34711 / CBS 6284 / DSM 70876 / NBRC 10599 / NRRL Y-10934 / UCD 77-7) TaxID=1071380 RepID=I2H087_HENB6|nr:hypothetical protein TBLA_0B09730 [Tetrapisispora blattae CBS 6284]CCH59789.1 hypothetical protein TBLA_0B09730 [Tetrapisispora blattae CBS 6284]